MGYVAVYNVHCLYELVLETDSCCALSSSDCCDCLDI